MIDFSSLTMGFKGFHARSSVESIPKPSGTINQFDVEDQMEGSPIEKSMLPFKSTSEKGCDEEMVLARHIQAINRRPLAEISNCPLPEEEYPSTCLDKDAQRIANVELK